MEELRFWYPASISQITEINDSFDSALLRVCYAGNNRNRSNLSKDVIEKAIPTMAYCPVVANYTVESDEIGGHDVEIVRTDSGDVKMVNLTDAIGVVPENPEWCWNTVTEEDGREQEYLSTPVILWKRAAVYDKLKRDGISGQSMEIRVKEGRLQDGVFIVDSFEFTAFCLLGDGIEPCFESASLEMFQLNKVSDRLGQMMTDFKKEFSGVMTATAADIDSPSGEENYMKGGESSLNVNDLMAKYGLTAEDVTVDLDGKTGEEIEALFSSIREAKFADDDPEAEPSDNNDDSVDGNNGDESATDTDNNEPGETDATVDDDNEDEPGGTKRSFQLTGEQMISGLYESLRKETYTDEWGTWGRYGYVDYYPDTNEVFAYDYTDWKLYGFTFSLNGDNVVIDFDSKKRKKFAYVDFDEGDVGAEYKYMFDGANARFAVVAKEVNELREFKKSVETAEHNTKVEEVFSRFEDIADDPKFAELRSNCANMSVEDIEDKCFAIRGRKVNVQMKFSQDGPKPVRLPVERNKKTDEPYGGLFLEFGVGK